MKTVSGNHVTCVPCTSSTKVILFHWFEDGGDPPYLTEEREVVAWKICFDPDGDGFYATPIYTFASYTRAKVGIVTGDLEIQCEENCDKTRDDFVKAMIEVCRREEKERKTAA